MLTPFGNPDYQVLGQTFTVPSNHTFALHAIGIYISAPQPFVFSVALYELDDIDDEDSGILLPDVRATQTPLYASPSYTTSFSGMLEHVAFERDNSDDVLAQLVADQQYIMLLTVDPSMPSNLDASLAIGPSNAYSGGNALLWNNNGVFQVLQQYDLALKLEAEPSATGGSRNVDGQQQQQRPAQSNPTQSPTRLPMITTISPITTSPTSTPDDPTASPSRAPTIQPTIAPTHTPTTTTTQLPMTMSPITISPTSTPDDPTVSPSHAPTIQPTIAPTHTPTTTTTQLPMTMLPITTSPTSTPSRAPTIQPTVAPTHTPTTTSPTTLSPTSPSPTNLPFHTPSPTTLRPAPFSPTRFPTTYSPTEGPTDSPSITNVDASQNVDREGGSNIKDAQDVGPNPFRLQSAWSPNYCLGTQSMLFPCDDARVSYFVLRNGRRLERVNRSQNRNHCLSGAALQSRTTNFRRARYAICSDYLPQQQWKLQRVSQDRFLVRRIVSRRKSRTKELATVLAYDTTHRDGNNEWTVMARLKPMDRYQQWKLLT